MIIKIEAQKVDLLPSFPQDFPESKYFSKMYLEHKEHFEGIKFRTAVNIPV